MAKGNDKATVEDVNMPGYTTQVNEAMYQALKQAMLKVLPTKEPGMTQSEIRQAVVAHLPQDLFPDRAKAGWWSETVQLWISRKKGIWCENRPSR